MPAVPCNQAPVSDSRRIACDKRISAPREKGKVLSPSPFWRKHNSFLLSRSWLPPRLPALRPLQKALSHRLFRCLPLPCQCRGFLPSFYRFFEFPYFSTSLHCILHITSLYPATENSSYASSSASFWICVMVSGFTADRMVTVFSAKVSSLHPSSILFMVLAAMGAQVPFSIRATLRFW